MAKHYKNETGTDFILDCGVLVGTAAEQLIYYKKPSGVIGSWSASLYDTYSALAGLVGTYFLLRALSYTDLSESGEWKFQAWVAAADGTWWGETAILRIYDKLE